jgi:16S rRNA (guanine(966)-N(2))-methyltransferase RsmD
VKKGAAPAGPAKRAPAAPRRAAPASEVRIVGGRWRRHKLAVLDRPGLRPTPDRIRETLFNWLGQDLTGWRVLDAFAGSGALGFEAASRGAAEVTMIERDEAALRALHEAKARLDAQAVRIERADALRWMAHVPDRRFDLVMLDPPFDAGIGEDVLAAALRLVSDGGYLYWEAAQPLAGKPDGAVIHRHTRAGAVHAHLLRPDR